MTEPQPDARLILEDLKAKAHVAESTHNPENIKALMDALNTYLDEELRESPSSEDLSQHVDGDGTPGIAEAAGDALLGNGPGEETPAEEEAEEVAEEEEEAEEEDEMTEAAPGEGMDLRTEIKTKLLEAIKDPEKLSALVEQIALGVEGGGGGEGAPPAAPEGEKQEAGGGGVICEACGHENKIREELATTSTAPSAIGESMASTGDAADAIGEANGYAAEVPPPEATEQNKHQKEEQTPMHESARGAGTTDLSSEERAELLALRVRERNRELLGEANKMIRESGVTGITAKELATFPKEQWPAFIKVARGAAGADDEMPMIGNADVSGVYVDEIRESAATSRDAGKSPRAVFESRMGIPRKTAAAAA